MTRNGFTLVELLVALTIFGLLSAAGVALLALGVTARGQASARLEALSDIARVRALITADLAQAAPRVYRDTQGAPQPAFAAGDARIALVRRGWSNDDGLARASLQRIEYRLSGDRFERLAWPMLDGTAPGRPMLLLTGVRSVRVRARSGGVWRDRWDPAEPRALPQAVEILLQLEHAPALRQLFLVGPDAS